MISTQLCALALVGSKLPENMREPLSGALTRKVFERARFKVSARALQSVSVLFCAFCYTEGNFDFFQN